MFNVHDLEFIYSTLKAAKMSFQSCLPFEFKKRDSLLASISDCDRICEMIEDYVAELAVSGGDLPDEKG